MSITIPAKNDYSFLFSNLNGSAQSSNPLYGINLADYACIKNGSYSKLMKAYYTKTDNDSSSSASSAIRSSVADKSAKLEKSELNSLQSTAEDVQDSAGKLMQRGTNSLFRKKDIETTAEDGTVTSSYDYDRNKIYSAVSNLVEDYNSLLDKGGDSSSTSVLSDTLSMIRTVNGYSSDLEAVGISIGSDNTLSIDKDAFMAADMEKVKDLFQGNSSLSYQISQKAVSIGNTAYSESNQGSLYNSSGSYASLATGDFINSII